MNPNIQWNFQFCISVPLTKKSFNLLQEDLREIVRFNNHTVNYVHLL